MKKIFTVLAVVGSIWTLLAAPLAHADRGESVTAKQMIDAINTVENQVPGRIKEIEVERKGGKTVIEIETIDSNGRERKIHVDPETGKILQ